MSAPPSCCATTKPPPASSGGVAHPGWRRLRPRPRRLAHRRGGLRLPLWFGLLLLYLLLADRVATARASSRDLYDVLGVARSADASTIKRAFRKLSIKYHPDKNAGDKAAETAYVEITSAYDVLSNPQKRNVPDLVIPLTVSLEAMYNGEVVQASRKRQVICSSWSDCESRCTTCGGSGFTVTTRRIGPGFIQQMRSPCPACGGSGQIVTECSTCPHGQFEQAEQVLLIGIVRGAYDGQRVAFEEMADELPGHATGSLEFELDAAPHPTFRREGDDLHVRMPLSLAEALVGVDRTVTQLDGRSVAVKLSGVTRPLQTHRVAGEGMPRADSDGAGDMVVTFWVEFPQRLTDAQRKVVVDTFGPPPSPADAPAASKPATSDGAGGDSSKEDL
ncbi:hypothetical protein I4F81_005765 [Pyropia yezoensis]|uniref:Uncharacterized protein n=1 Tax=Pyropia yezoensis TaxID=2788 RepID=A0ACC3BZ61_PYRYE|nr:hypothetical protein I4F81_005765 [Neopyropia yezoensis]